MKRKHIKQITDRTWWTYVTTDKGDRVEFEGDLFPNESDARVWYDARPEQPA